LESLAQEAVAAIPPCAGDEQLKHIVVGGIRRFLPKTLTPRSLNNGARPSDDGQPWIA
jgi:hypothetical protein